jgi:predicted house-cleaning noncanonical NTP pyrophosphatase (MazG superfamily)
MNYSEVLSYISNKYLVNAGGKKSEIKNANQEDWKERLMAKNNQEVESRLPKQVT